MKKFLLMLALVPASLMIQGCDDTSTSSGVRVVGRVTIGTGHGRGCATSTVRRCYRYRGRWGRVHRSCRYVRVCTRRWDVAAVDKAMNTMGIQQQNAVESRAALFAERYQISDAAAAKVVNAFDKGGNGDFAAFSRLGVSRAEMESLYYGNGLSKEATRTLARELDISESHANAIVKDMNQRVRAAQ